MENPKLSIIIVSFNVKNLLEKLLESLYFWLKGVNFEIIVVDNNSADGSQNRLRQS